MLKISTSIRKRKGKEMFVKSKKRIVIWVFCALVFCGAVFLQILSGITSASERKSLGMMYQDNSIKMVDGASISQTFVEDESFYGVSVMVGWASSQKFGSINMKLINNETGELVCEDNINTFRLKSIQYVDLGSYDIIEIEHPTEFTLEISADWDLLDKGVTFAVSSEDCYEDGVLTVNGELTDTDLMVETITEYAPGFKWAMFFLRLFVMTVVFAFVSLNCLCDLVKLYDFIFRKRVIIAIVTFVVMVALNLNFSSIGMYNEYIQKGEGTDFIDPVFGTPQGIRSDEWLVNVSRLFSAEYCDYGPINNITRGTETDGLAASGLYLSYSALAMPCQWGYYLFGSARGLSFFWCFRIIFGFLFAFEFCYILTRFNRKYALLGASLITFSMYYMWWSTVTWVLTVTAVFTFLYYFLHEEKIGKRCLFGVGIALSGANFVVDLYPAWQVPIGIVSIFILIWMFYGARENLKQYKLRDWGIAIFFIVFMASIVVVYFINDAEYMTAISNTVYPGAREEVGGMVLYKLINYFNSAMSCYVTRFYPNPSEMGCFFGVFPLGGILFIICMIRKKGKALLDWLILIPSTLIFAYCTTPLPYWLAKVTLLTFSKPSRAADILGFIMVIMFVVALSDLKENGKLPLWLGAVVSVFSVGIALKYAKSIVPDGRLYYMMLAIGIGLIFIDTILISDVSDVRNNVAYSLLVVSLIITGLRVNPLMCGIDALTSKPLTKEVRKIVDAEPDSKWIATDSLVDGDYLAAIGASTINSTNYIPNWELWDLLDCATEDVYNRYAHMVVYLVDANTESRAELMVEDTIVLYLSVNDLEKLDVDYILAVGDMSAYKDYVTKVYYGSSYYIYKVNDN